MEEIKKIIAIGLCATVVSLVLKKNTPEFALICTIVSGIIISLLICDYLSNVINVIKEIFIKSGLEPSIINTVLKICAISIVSEYFCNVMEDSGESAIAKRTEFASKIIIFTYTLPMIVKVIDSIWSLM